MKPLQMDTIFNFPAVHTQILFGYGTIKELHQRVKNLGGKKVLLVSDTGVVKAGILDTIHEILERGGISVIRFTEVPQDSSTMVATKGAGLLETERCDMVIGVGGGSSLDSAKAIAVAATNPLPLSQYAGLNKVQNKPLPVIAIPTTAGTGSEVSFWSVMTNEENRVKIGIGGELVFPTLAVCDPDLTVSLPPFFTATTGMDALVHAMESYVNRSYQPISSVFTYRAMELIGQFLVRAVHDGSDREARYGMLLGSLLAGLGMNPTRLGIAHALAMPLGSWELKIAHGTCNAVLIPAVMEFNLDADSTAYSEVAEALGVEVVGLSSEQAARKGVQRVREISEQIGIPQGLGSLGLREEDISKVCAEAMKSGNIAANPKSAVQKDLEEICRKSM